MITASILISFIAMSDYEHDGRCRCRCRKIAKRQDLIQDCYHFTVDRVNIQDGSVNVSFNDKSYGITVQK